MENTNPLEVDNLETEKKALNTLLQKGMKFSVPKHGLLRLLSKKKEREFTIVQPFLGTLDMLSEIFLQIEFDEKKIQENPLSESKYLLKYSGKLAQIVAIAVCNSNTKFRIRGKKLTRYFLWHLTPEKMLQIVLIISSMNNTMDFINSIRLMSVVRTTIPKALIEVEQKV